MFGAEHAGPGAAYYGRLRKKRLAFELLAKFTCFVAAQLDTHDIISS